jgi:hypothetical protein
VPPAHPLAPVTAGLALALALPLGMEGRARAEIRSAAWAEMLVGGGHDTNPFLQVAASPDSATWHSTDGPWFWRVAPVVGGVISGEHLRLKVEYGADLRRGEGSGVLFVHEGTASVTALELGPLSASLGFRVGHYDNTRYDEDRFTWTAGETGLAIRLGATLRTALRYRLDRRSFGDPDAVGVSADWAHFAEARVDASPRAALTLGAAVDYQTLRSTPLDAAVMVGQLDRVHLGLDARFSPPGPVTLFGVVWAGVQSHPGLAADRRVGGALLAHLRLTRMLGALFRYDVQVTRATDAASTSYSRRVALLGLQLQLSTVTLGRLPTAAAQDEAPRVERGRVLFRVRARGAAGVAVIGSWNEWDDSALDQQLERTRDPDLWERWVNIGAGRHRYHVVVDGKATRPRDAPQYRSDGMGSEDGVVEVPGRPGS